MPMLMCLLLVGPLPTCNQRDLVRGFSFRVLNAIDIRLEVTKSAPPGGAAVNCTVNYINFEPL